MVEKELFNFDLTQEMARKEEFSSLSKNIRDKLKQKTPTNERKEADVHTSSTPKKSKKVTKIQILIQFSIVDHVYYESKIENMICTHN